MAEHCYTDGMASVTLDDDVRAELAKLAERSGRSVDALANAVLRDFARYENQVTESVERGIADLDAGRIHTTDEVLAYLRERRRTR